jgi:hypothetical protein
MTSNIIDSELNFRDRLLGNYLRDFWEIIPPGEADTIAVKKKKSRPKRVYKEVIVWIKELDVSENQISGLGCQRLVNWLMRRNTVTAEYAEQGANHTANSSPFGGGMNGMNGQCQNGQNQLGAMAASSSLVIGSPNGPNQVSPNLSNDSSANSSSDALNGPRHGSYIICKKISNFKIYKNNIGDFGIGSTLN